MIKYNQIIFEDFRSFWSFGNIVYFGQIDKIDNFQDLGVFGNIVYFGQIDKIVDFQDLGVFGEYLRFQELLWIVGDWSKITVRGRSWEYRLF